MVGIKKSKHIWRTLGLTLIFVIILMVLAYVAYQKFVPQKVSSELNANTIEYLDDRDPQKKYSVQEIDESIDLAAFYLNSHIQQDGKFVYRKNLNPKVRLHDKYNILRHSGTIFALCNYYKHTGDQNSLNNAHLALRFLLDSSVKPISDTTNYYGVWSLPDINKAKRKAQLKLGGTGIGLLALMSFYECVPEFKDIDLVRRMGDFLIYMQKEDGSFYSKYYPGRGPDDSWTSLYYPGEAALGLVLLYEEVKDVKYLNAAAKAIKYLFEIRKGKDRVEADHWALLASERLVKYKDHFAEIVSEEHIYQHAFQICISIMTQIPDYLPEAPYYGSLTNAGRTTPTATRLEGLISAYKFLPDEYVGLKVDLAVVIENGINFLVRSQVQKGDCKGGIPRAYFLSEKFQLYFGIVPDKRDTEIRIDYNQHAMCAMMQWIQVESNN